MSTDGTRLVVLLLCCEVLARGVSGQLTNVDYCDVRLCLRLAKSSTYTQESCAYMQIHLDPCTSLAILPDQLLRDWLITHQYVQNAGCSTAAQCILGLTRIF